MQDDAILPDGLDALAKEFELAQVMKLIEQTARWVDPEVFKVMPVWYPESARRAPLYKANWSERLSNTNKGSGESAPKNETNENANRALTLALGLKPDGRTNWSCCHVWGVDDAAYQASNVVVQDPRFYSCVANMVLLPTPLKAFTDSMPEVKMMLRHCAANLYAWRCDHEVLDSSSPDDDWVQWPAYPKSWPRRAHEKMPLGVRRMNPAIRSNIAARLSKIRNDVEHAGPMYPRKQVRTVLSYWRQTTDCRSFDRILDVVHADGLPDGSDPDDVFAFAMTFNGYERLGSFEASEAAARARTRANLDDIRNELFFEARASRHRGDEHFLRTYVELLPLFQKFATGGTDPAI